mmetsp:Transcript_47958/g.55475  ORF Transcript_47958/g.55475 Transcript_47958/m.55475 type:complete len:309 (-) Transcript_47958:58-984(-)
MQTKVSDLIVAEKADQIYVSFEFFPPRTEKGEQTLINEHMLEFAKQNPVFVDFTWGAGGTTSEKTPALCVASMSHGLNVNMHLTCTNMEEGKVRQALDLCKEKGIRNIVALRGDPPAGQEWKASAEGFTCALDLVKYIRANYGDYFSICVAGYPEGHPDKIQAEKGVMSSEDEIHELNYLKQKVDAGADVIITQLFYDSNVFIRFVKKCREHGITVPILPGMLPMVSYAGLKRMVTLCKTYLPDDVVVETEALKEDEEGFKAYGIELTTKMIQEIIAADIGIHHFHFYTLNLPHSTMSVLKKLGLYKA